MKMLTSLLDKLYKAQARMFKPVSEKDLRALRMSMAKEKMPALPSDYLQFLGLTDGLMYNGLRFFGAIEHDRGLLAYTYPDLLSINRDFRQLNRRQDILILGEKDEDWLVYSPKMKTYQLMDKMDLIGDLNLPRFFDLIYFFSQELLNADDKNE
ncbi:MAG: SMI1/KNR4 family protein [Alphaproteobacteria bacterium]|nr:SMI1/KNR4 family protein [Alphaproteobacteria bacterium]